MGACTICGTSQSRLNGGLYCKKCFNDINKGSVKHRDTESVNAATGIGNDESSLPFNDDQLLNQLTVKDLKSIMHDLFKPVQNDISTIRNQITQSITSHGNRLKLLEADNIKKQNEMASLKGAIIGMQKSINMLDNDNRKVNFIISGLPENEIALADNILRTDEEKLETMLDSIPETRGAYDISKWDIKRLGKEKDDSTRVIKVVTTSMEERDSVLSNAPKIKGLQAPLNKVFFKKDLHPVYARENQRIRKKRYELVERYKNEDGSHEVKIVKGQLQVDGVTVDRNLFFSINAGIQSCCVSILFWNINGVGDKFNNENVTDIICHPKYDVIIITESHFNIRVKTPVDYYFVAKSKSDQKTKLRGGVAIYQRKSCIFDIDVLSTDFTDVIIFQIRDSAVTVAAVYLPPVDSKYYSNNYFENLDLICDTFSRNSQFYVVGDLNSRISTPQQPTSDICYKANPDKVINTHGRQLLKIIEKHKLIVVNGCMKGELECDSKFTYFKGKKCSQNDIAFCNDIDNVRSYSIMNKSIFSDHCPIELSFNISIRPSLSIVKDSSRYSFSYDHLDINKHLKRPISLRNMDPMKLVTELDKLSNELPDEYLPTNIDNLSNQITNGIYKACKSSSCKRRSSSLTQNPNCTSKNIRAISEAHFSLYIHKLKSNSPPNETEAIAIKWWEYNCLAEEMERKEFNTNVNKKWLHCRKADGRKLWQLIDWKGKVQSKLINCIEPDSVNEYFTGIFQSNKTLHHPTVSDIINEVKSYSIYNQISDSPITKIELLPIFSNVGNGVGLDGIPPSIEALLPESIRDKIQRLLRCIFENDVYPRDWIMQLLIPIAKKGNTILSPQLRGISLSSFLPRIYDAFIDNRFKTWYEPNKEQSGFRKGQGCILQLFYVALIIEMAKQLRKNLYLLLVDYEKAFDYANRSTLIKDMMKNGVGKKFVVAVANMYYENGYIPKVEDNLLGTPIRTRYGVTQGRRSSTNFFSFLISEMPQSITNTNDFMDPHSLAQMADDTIIAAENQDTLGIKFEDLFNFSRRKYQVINLTKTKYVHMSKSPFTECITCRNGTTTIHSLKEGESISYLGMHLLHTISLTKIVRYNLDKRMFNVAKFKAWLDVNKNTPFPIKMMVLDSCVLNAILYGCEVWGNLLAISKKLLTVELDLLKSILGVKKGTPNDLVYHELNRGNIVTRIKDRQLKFIKQLDHLNENEAIVKSMWIKSQQLDSNISKYYNQLSDDNYEQDKLHRKNALNTSMKTMDVRYRELIGLERDSNCLYDSYVSDTARVIITRWRLSNYKLAIETGRYSKPAKPRNERCCLICLKIEDENHAVFHCPLYKDIRSKYTDILKSSNSVTKILNPRTKHDLYETAKLLTEIEKAHKKFFE